MKGEMLSLGWEEGKTVLFVWNAIRSMLTFLPRQSATCFSSSAPNFRGPGYSGLRGADYRHGGWHQQTGHVQMDDKLPVNPENEERRAYKLIGRGCALLKRVQFFPFFCQDLHYHCPSNDCRAKDTPGRIKDYVPNFLSNDGQAEPSL